MAGYDQPLWQHDAKLAATQSPEAQPTQSPEVETASPRTDPRPSQVNLQTG